MPYIADTFHIGSKTKQNVTIYHNSWGWFITGENGYLHFNGMWYPGMGSVSLNGNTLYQYHSSEESAIDLCKKYDYDYTLA